MTIPAGSGKPAARYVKYFDPVSVNLNSDSPQRGWASSNPARRYAESSASGRARDLKPSGKLNRSRGANTLGLWTILFTCKASQLEVGRSFYDPAVSNTIETVSNQFRVLLKRARKHYIIAQNHDQPYFCTVQRTFQELRHRRSNSEDPFGILPTSSYVIVSFFLNNLQVLLDQVRFDRVTENRLRSRSRSECVPASILESRDPCLNFIIQFCGHKPAFSLVTSANSTYRHMTSCSCNRRTFSN